MKKCWLVPLSGDPGALNSFQSPSWCNSHLVLDDDDEANAAKGQSCPRLLRVSFQNALFLWCSHFDQILQSKLQFSLHIRHRTRCRWPPPSNRCPPSLLCRENNHFGHNFLLSSTDFLLTSTDFLLTSTYFLLTSTDFLLTSTDFLQTSTDFLLACHSLLLCSTDSRLAHTCYRAPIGSSLKLSPSDLSRF